MQTIEEKLAPHIFKLNQYGWLPNAGTKWQYADAIITVESWGISGMEWDISCSLTLDSEITPLMISFKRSIFAKQVEEGTLVHLP